MKLLNKKTVLLILPLLIFLGMTNCSQFRSFSEADKSKFLSQNPVFRDGVRQGQDPNDEAPALAPDPPNTPPTTVTPPPTCPSGYRLNSAKTGCERIPVTPPPPVNPPGGDGGDGGGDGGDGGGCPLMIDSQGVQYADVNQLRNSDDSYFNGGELNLSAPEDGVKFNLLGKQTKTVLNNGDFLHIKPQAHNFKFQISWTKPEQSRYRWLTLPDENGHINGIDQLFGDNTFGPDSQKPFAKDGFRALMKWDRGDALNTNQSLADGYIDSNDAVFSELRLWHDLNGDGNCDSDEEIESELVSLHEVGITYIHLMVNENFRETDSYGNHITYKSLVGFETNGEQTKLGTAFDIWFLYNTQEILETGYAEIKNQ